MSPRQVAALGLATMVVCIVGSLILATNAVLEPRLILWARAGLLVGSYALWRTGRWVLRCAAADARRQTEVSRRREESS